MRVFVTGGAGYIGSHTILELLRAGHEVHSCDNYCNSSPEALRRVRRLANADLGEANIDVRDCEKLTQVLANFLPEVVIHFAGLKAVGASAEEPLNYYDNNVSGTLSLLKAMDGAGCEKIVFSSSATVYGAPRYLPYDEAHPLAPANTYGRTKLMAEQVINDWHGSTPGSSAALLRYFNPVGAHPSGEIGEDPNGVPDNLMPYIAQVAVGRRLSLSIFGNDYDTRDGTGERDYIHVVDLARAHVAAIDFVSATAVCEAFNIGTGTAYSVKEVVKGFEAASSRTIPVEVAPRRAGDLASYYADPSKALDRLGWRAEYGLEDICGSTWAWQSRNPQGYQ
ncbi:UDP-glucose 4-epimerase GalE [Altererythrobacter ishigakiensis]|uniref:UDP-glucose 4-epimerase n=1 Tax=Altererythrobacter ishigakiensis TaxID=476157 RepID=A0A562USN7_9SPHN|nr:UDP-glucose 4-epimerase GalE [Altererythrobacter ishigakiensis]TWJ08635.1 UDP-glucose 4-epimerase [Altererythrobacter ishigakiensis]